MKKIIVFILTALLFLKFFIPINASADSISAEAYVVINADNCELIAARNENSRMPMASTTKIMTALLLCEYGFKEREITVSEQMVRVEGSSMGLLPGDTVTLNDLLYGIMLASGNDAANTAAFVVGGSIENFVALMNKKAKEIGLKDTNFVTPSGLDAKEHYTTAYELACLAAFAMKNDRFKEAAKAQTHTAYYGNPPYRRTITNHNKLLKLYEGANGIKTGFTKKSGRCLVSSATRDGKNVIAVTLNAPSDWQDHKTLLDLGFSSLKNEKIKYKTDKIYIDVVGGNKNTVAAIVPEVSLNTTEKTSFSLKVINEPFLYAPIRKGEKIAELLVYTNGTILKTLPLTAESDVNKEKDSFLNCLIRQFFAIVLSI